MHFSYRSLAFWSLLLGLLSLLVSPSLAINLTQCAIEAESAFVQAPSANFLVQQDGSFTQNFSRAWGIRYGSCNQLCGPKGSWEPFDWTFFTSSFSSWLLPYLALAAQMPYEAKDTPGNLMILFIILGSPMLVVYSLILTVANTRWINREFRRLKDENKEAGGDWVAAITAARRCFVEGQQVPIQVFQGPERELAHLIVLPQNRSWWVRLENELKKTRRPWTYSLFAQLFWVFFAQLLAIVDFLQTASTSSIGLGLAINSLWIWMIPVSLGWVCVGTQTSAGTFKAATMAIDPPKVGDGLARYGRNVGIRVRNANAVPFSLETDKEAAQAKDLTTLDGEVTVTDKGRTRFDNDAAQTHVDVIEYTEQVAMETACEERGRVTWVDDVEVPARYTKQTFLGFSIAGDETEPGPIYNFARLWTHRNATSQVIDGFRGLTTTLKDGTRRTVHGGPWDPKDWDRNFQGSPVALSRYISSRPKNFDTDYLRVYGGKSSASLTKVSIVAFICALILQWGTTGGAIIIAYLTPTVGLGCESGTYLFYGTGATLSCLLLIFSSYLSHIWAASTEDRSFFRPSTPSLPRLLGPLAVITRAAGKTVALVNACWVLIASTLQFTKLFFNCWCESDVLGLGPSFGWVVIFATNTQVADSARVAWGTGIALSLTTVGVFTLFVIFGTGNDALKE